MSLFVMSNRERNERKRLRKQRANPKPKGRRTDIPLSHIEAARIRFECSDGMPVITDIEHAVVPR